VTVTATSSGSAGAGHRERRATRHRLRLPGRLIWRDAGGALRFVAVETRDVSEADTFVECQVPASIPLYRLVHFQIEPSARTHANLPATLKRGKILSAVYRVGACSASMGTPQGYALRLLVEPSRRTRGKASDEAVAATR